MDINTDLIEKQLVINDDNISELGNDTVERNVIKEFDFITINNIKITEKMKQNQNPYFFLYFDLFSTYNFIKIGELNNKYLEHYTEQKNKKYVLFTYKNNKFIDLDIFLLNLPTPKLFVFHIIDSFTHLLKSLLILNEQNICFFNVSTKNIAFDNGFKPILRNFTKSLLLNNMEEEYLSNIIEKIDNYTLKPLEIHILFYLIHNEEETLSYSSVEFICDHFVENNSILDLFSEQYREGYYKLCLEVLKKYINKPKCEIIRDIIHYSFTWDNYSLSFLYLFFVGNLVKIFSLKDCFLSKFSILLNKNLHPDPLKRETLTNTQTNVNKLFSEYTEWDFVNNLSMGKYINYLKIINN